MGPRRRLPARPHPAGRPRRRAAGDKVAAQTPRPIAAQPAARSSLALARRRPGPAWCSGDVTAALVARVTASRPCLRIGAAARGPCARVRAHECARVSARARERAPRALAPTPKPTCASQLHLSSPVWGHRPSPRCVWRADDSRGACFPKRSRAGRRQSLSENRGDFARGPASARMRGAAERVSLQLRAGDRCPSLPEPLQGCVLEKW